MTSLDIAGLSEMLGLYLGAASFGLSANLYGFKSEESRTPELTTMSAVGSDRLSFGKTDLVN